MYEEDNELTIKEKAIREYNAYKATQIGFVAPVADISIEKGDKRTEVTMDVEYNNTNFHFEAIKPEHAEVVYTYVNSQPLVRGKFAHGRTVDLPATTARVKQLSDRFDLKESGEPVDPKLHLYGGFVVSDAENNTFLGMCNIGGSSVVDHAEMAFLNRVEAWSRLPSSEIVREFELEDKPMPKQYRGTGTAETCVLLQYLGKLKQDGYKINGTEVTALDSTARLDNPGSWKSNAKAGMEVYDVDSNPSYGPELRYQLRKTI